MRPPVTDTGGGARPRWPNPVALPVRRFGIQGSRQHNTSKRHPGTRAAVRVKVWLRIAFTVETPEGARGRRALQGLRRIVRPRRRPPRFMAGFGLAIGWTRAHGGHKILEE